jgi:hypothetical protein
MKTTIDGVEYEQVEAERCDGCAAGGNIKLCNAFHAAGYRCFSGDKSLQWRKIGPDRLTAALDLLRDAVDTMNIHEGRAPGPCYCPLCVTRSKIKEFLK